MHGTDQKTVLSGKFSNLGMRVFVYRYTKMCWLSVHFPCVSCLHRDRLRTTTNVLGDSLGAGILGHLSRKELESQDAELHNSVENDSLEHRNSETTM